MTERMQKTVDSTKVASRQQAGSFTRTQKNEKMKNLALGDFVFAAKCLAIPYPRITTLVDSIMLALKSAEGWRISPSNSVARKTTCANTSTANSRSSKVGASKTEEAISSRLATFASICHLPDASYLIHYRHYGIRLHACSVCGDTYLSRSTSYVRPIMLESGFSNMGVRQTGHHLSLLQDASHVPISRRMKVRFS